MYASRAISGALSRSQHFKDFVRCRHLWMSRRSCSIIRTSCEGDLERSTIDSTHEKKHKVSKLKPSLGKRRRSDREAPTPSAYHVKGLNNPARFQRVRPVCLATDSDKEAELDEGEKPKKPLSRKQREKIAKKESEKNTDDFWDKMEDTLEEKDVTFAIPTKKSLQAYVKDLSNLKEGEWQKSLEILVEMEESGIELEGKPFELVLVRLGEDGRPDEALALLESMSERGLLTASGFTSVVQAYSNSGQVMKGVSFVLAMPKVFGVDPDIVAIESLIACVKQPAILEILQKQKDRLLT